MKILIVDDSRAMRVILRRTLSALDRFAGATIIEASNGREGFDAVLRDEPDLVLSDWKMPEMTGIEFLQALHAAGATPVFGFVTSELDPEARELAIELGARTLVAKPFTAAALDQALAEALASEGGTR